MVGPPTHGSTSVDSTNLGPGGTTVYAIEKHLHGSGPVQVRPTLFKSQQDILIYYRFRLKGLIGINLVVLSALIFSPFYR